MKPLFTIAVLALIASSSLWAQDRAEKTEVKRIPAHTPEWTNLNTSDPGTTDSVVPELQSIVVLCATDPKAKKIAPATKKWLASNPRAAKNVDAVIDDIMRRADEHREKIGKKKRSAKSAKKVEKILRDAMKAAINNVR